jgi:hydrogenase maturation factor
LLAAIAPDHAKAAVKALIKAGYQATIVGEINDSLMITTI